MSIKWDKNFKKEVLAIEKEMIEDAKKIIGFALVTYHSLVKSVSPVDTGRYKASHVFETSRSNRTDGENTESEIKQYRFDFKNGVYYIANNLEYASILEAGRSQQAPQGVYGPSERKLEAALRKKFADFNRKRY